jgi:hypothetical protein
LITWFPDIVNAFIYFQTDGYVQGFQIASLNGNSTVATFLDPNNLSVTTSGTPWVIRGYKLNNRPQITAIAIGYVQNGSNMQVYPGASSSAGVGNGGENPS